MNEIELTPQQEEDARFDRYRACRIKTLLGEAVYERAYYHCSHCHQGICPTDSELALFTSRLREPVK